MSDLKELDRERLQQWVTFVTRFCPTAEPGTVQLAGLLHRVAHGMHRLGEQNLVDDDLSLAQLRLMMHLRFSELEEGQSSLNPSHISRRQGISRNAVSALIRSLEKRGLIARQLDENDRRRFQIALTPAGRQLFDRAGRKNFEILNDCFTILNASEQADLRHLLLQLGRSPQLALESLPGG